MRTVNRILVRGGNRLVGEVQVKGAKNGVLPLIAASLLASTGVTRLNQVPSVSDVMVFVKILRELGVPVETGKSHLDISAEQIPTTKTTSALASSIRASVFLMGPLLARKKRFFIPTPGGCKIGSRPIDLHIQGLEQMGATFDIHQNYIEGHVEEDWLKGADISLRFPSVGATLNLLSAAVLAKGETVIQNAAKDPEIGDMIEFLKKMGADIEKVEGVQADRILIRGVDELRAVEHTTIRDRIEAGTYLIAAAATGGDVFVKGAVADHLSVFLEKLKEMGVQVNVRENGINVNADQPLEPVHIETGSYPKFPTDLQPQMMVLQHVANGTSTMKERIFPHRFKHVPGLQQMGANISLHGSTARIQGGKPLIGKTVKANDMRAAAALIIAGLVAEGRTDIYPHFLRRGYDHFLENLVELGADIRRVHRSLVLNKRDLDRPKKWDAIYPYEKKLEEI